MNKFVGALSDFIIDRPIAKYNPDQPRAPSGSPDGGRWSAIGGSVGHPNPLNDRERLVGAYDDNRNEMWGGLDVSDSSDGWHLHDVRAITRGGGRVAMEHLVELADEHGKRISLHAVPGISPGGKKLSRAKLRRWYQGFGFKPDYGEVMIREPNPVEKYNRNHRGPGPGGGRFTTGSSDAVFEVAPNPDNTALTDRWNSLTDEQKKAISDAVAAKIAPQVMNEIGLNGQLHETWGGFEGHVNPSYGLTMADAGSADQAARALGYTLSQKSVVVMAEAPGAGLGPLGIARITVPANMQNPNGLASIYSNLQGLNHAEHGQLVDGFTYSNGKMTVLNFTSLSNKDYATAVFNHLNGEHDVIHGTVYSSYIEAKDYGHSEGGRAGRTSGRRGLDRLRAQATTQIEAGLRSFGKSEARGGSGQAEGLEKHNPNHHPAGSSRGGQFAPREGGYSGSGAAGGNKAHPTALQALGPDGVKTVRDLLEDPNATAEEILAALSPADKLAAGMDPTIPDDQNPSPDFFAKRKYAGGMDVDQAKQALIDTANAYAGPDGPAAERKAMLIIGAPAAGKSTTAEALAESGRYAIVDSDDAKKIIPEFAGGIGATAVHNEGKILSENVLGATLAAGSNVILPLVGHTVSSVEKKVSLFEGAGYKVDIVGVDVSENNAAKRMAGRFLNTGRLIPTPYFASIGDRPAKTLDYFNGKGTNGTARINANGVKGSETVDYSSIPGLSPGQALF